MASTATPARVPTGRPRLPETVTLSGAEVYGIAGLLLGVDEVLVSLDADGINRLGEQLGHAGQDLYGALFGDDYPHDDHGYETDPRIVDRWATGDEQAAAMLDAAIGGGRPSDAVYGVSVREAKAIVGKLEARAAAVRLAGDITYDRELAEEATDAS